MYVLTIIQSTFQKKADEWCIVVLCNIQIGYYERIFKNSFSPYFNPKPKQILFVHRNPCLSLLANDQISIAGVMPKVGQM